MGALLAFPGVLVPGVVAVGVTGAVWIDPPAVADGARQLTSLLMTSAFLLVATMGEEVGWRGLALPSLQRHRSPLAASVVQQPIADVVDNSVPDHVGVCCHRRRCESYLPV